MKPANRTRTGRRRVLSRTVFQPGQSGNPSGRPKKTEEERTLEALCREKTPAALNTILEIMNKGTERNRLAAAEYVIDRGWGKATQRQEAIEKVTAQVRYVAELPPRAPRVPVINGELVEERGH